jgi:hypothetical protein
MLHFFVSLQVSRITTARKKAAGIACGFFAKRIA